MMIASLEYREDNVRVDTYTAVTLGGESVLQANQSYGRIKHGSPVQPASSPKAIFKPSMAATAYTRGSQ
jgi:hypothetical protein